MVCRIFKIVFENFVQFFDNVIDMDIWEISSGSKDEFVDMYRIIKGGRNELTEDLKKKLIGLRSFSTGFEALIKTEDIKPFAYLDIEPAAINDIVVFTAKKGEQYE